MSQSETDFEPRYYTLDRTKESEQFLFSHNGLFNLWNKILLFHWNEVYLLLIAPLDMLESSDSETEVVSSKEKAEAIYAFWDYVDVLDECLKEMLDGIYTYGDRDLYTSYARLIKNMLKLTKECINKEVDSDD